MLKGNKIRLTMSYEAAINKAWDDIERLARQNRLEVEFLADKYVVDVQEKTVSSLSCNVNAKVHIAILVIHYLIKKLYLGVLPRPTGEWISFKQLDGGEFYYPTFKKRTIEVVTRKFEVNPGLLTGAIEKFKARKAQFADSAVIIEPFEGVLIMVQLWKADAEFSTEVNILFDKNIAEIFCTEDVVVLTETLAHSL